MEKLTEEYVKEQFGKRGYKLLDKYKNSQVVSLVEKDGYKAYIKYGNFSMGKNPSFFSVTNPFLGENIKNFISKKDSSVLVLGIKIITKSHRKRILVILRCGCGELYNKIWDDIYGKTYVKCNKCMLLSRGKNHRKDQQETLKLFRERGYKILNEQQNFIRSENIEVENEQGYRGFVSYNRLLLNRNIAIFEHRTNEKNYIYNINNYCRLQNIKTKAIGYADNQKWTTRGIKFICGCGKEYETSIISFQSGKIACDDCSRRSSRYERLIQNFLEKQQIKYISQFRINSCRDVLPLPFDFYLKDYNKIIEVDGEGHYYPCHFNQIGYEDALKTFEITKKHDDMKNEYCKKYSIPLLRVSYKEIINKEYKNKIMQFVET